MQAELLRVGDVVIEEVDLASLSDAQIGVLNTFQNALRAETLPEEPAVPLERAILGIRNIPDLVALKMFCGRAPDESVVALASGTYLRTGDNLHRLDTMVHVHPDQRRQGLGTAMLTPLLAYADAQGRTLLSGQTNERAPAGAAFAERIGAQSVQDSHTNRLVLADVDRTLVRRWLDEGPERAPGYSLQWVDGPAPEDLIEQIVNVMHVMNDAPRDGRQVEDMHITVDQYREMDRLVEAQDYAHWAVYARHDANGQLVGLSDVSWLRSEPTHVYQQNTGVRPEHRGHALGKWLKAAMLERLLDEGPPATDIRTSNADSNDAMLRINRELGFEPYIASAVWEVTTDQVRSYLDDR
jgi:GNAT superfamily N-acetyltransferase